MTCGYDRPLYLLPFDHRASFEMGMFGWKGVLRTIFWKPLVGWREKRTTRETAVDEVARRYREFVDTFEKARAQ